MEGPEALSTTNVLPARDDRGHDRLFDVCDANSPKATIILGCWLKDIDAHTLEGLRAGAKADLAAASLGEASQLCVEAAGHAIASQPAH